MIKKILTSFTLLLTVTVTTSEAARLTDSELAELPASAKKLVLFNRDIIDRGGKGTKSISFKDTNYQFSITAIYDAKNNEPPMHIVVVSSDGNEANIGFKIVRKCTLTEQGDPLINRVIRVDGTNISAAMGCGKDPSNQGVTQEVFVLKTQAGKAYVQKQFSENPYVFVDFGSGEVPFATDGFNALWQRTDEPAL
ncbi:hypothetical protein NGA35_04815 [Pseudomonas stutzeri]|uniref:hypothetical protein n=1 Tax=Pseudomonas sp. AOB-7 TaxID=2482750 RepID=UPI0011C4AA57|nr:hypothetical protein [Pseudomonas sp. AOB-7]MCQ4346762.1 hypothetical protein [Stutzerimonas stutzeri]